MTIFKIGDVVQIKRTSGNLTSATIFKISENDLEVTWLENHRKIGKKIYKNEVISNISQLRTSRSKTTIFFILGIIILVIFAFGVSDTYYSSIEVKF